MREREHVLQLENITMQFGGVVAVNNLSLEVNKGEIVALIGPERCWKNDGIQCDYRRLPAHQWPGTVP